MLTESVLCIFSLISKENSLYNTYFTGKLCNQAFRKMPKNSRHFAKSLIHLVMPGIRPLLHNLPGTF